MLAYNRWRKRSTSSCFILLHTLTCADLQSTGIGWQVELIEQKEPWIVYNTAMEEFGAVKKRRLNAEKALEEKKEKYIRTQQPLQ